MKVLGEKLRAIREALDLNQVTMAQRVGRQQRDISDLEKGKRKTLPPEFIHFLHEEGIDLNWLFSSTPLQQPEPYLEQYLRYRTAGEVPPVLGNEAHIRMVSRHYLHDYPALHTNLDFQRKLETVQLPGPDFASAPEDLRGFQMADDSMLETLAPHDWVIARRSHTPLPQLTPGYVYVVVTRHQVIVGRLSAPRNGHEDIRLVFDQEGYPPVHIPDAHIEEIWRGQAKLCATLTGNKNNLHRQLEHLQHTMEELRDQFPS